MFSSDQLVSLSPDALLADEATCEKLAKAAIDYAFEMLQVASEVGPNARQSSFLCVIEDAIIHHIDCGLQTHATVGELEQDLRSLIDELGEIFHSTQSALLPQPKAAVH
ncbi:MAG: hypothetical protein GY947_20695 [Rhodobacteraceae bacterium]|nr:hypothetical protein [Paracoccaceae bacterium]